LNVGSVSRKHVKVIITSSLLIALFSSISISILQGLWEGVIYLMYLIYLPPMTIISVSLYSLYKNRDYVGVSTIVILVIILVTVLLSQNISI